MALLLLSGFQGFDWLLVLDVDTTASVMTDFGKASIQKTPIKASAMHKLDIFREIFRLHQEGDAWLDKIPEEVCTAFFYNPYVESLCKTIDLLTAKIFTESEIEDMDWFLSEWFFSQGLKSDSLVLNDKEAPINSIDDYINLLVSEGKWDLTS